MSENGKYLHVMRGEVPPTYGASASNIVEMYSPRKKASKVQVVLIVDGEEFVFTDVEVQTQFSNGVYKILIGHVGSKMPEDSPVAEQDRPKTTGFVGLDSSQEQFYLEGDNLDTFLKLSPFRHEDNKAENTTKQVTSAALETTLYNIMSTGDAVKDAAMELVGQEQELISQGFKVVKVEQPRFTFSKHDPEQNEFKLVETALLIKESENTHVTNEEAGSVGSSETESTN